MDGRLAYLAGRSIESPEDKGFSWRCKYSFKLNKELDIKCIMQNNGEESDGCDIHYLRRIDPKLFKRRIFCSKVIDVGANSVESADMVIVKWNGESVSKTMHEIRHAYEVNTPCFLVTELEVRNIPCWFLTYFTRIFCNLDELILYLKMTASITFIVDIDGTVCDSMKRVNEISKKYGLLNTYGVNGIWSRNDLSEFLQEDKIMEDTVIPGAERLNNIVDKYNGTLIFLTGRNEVSRRITRKWLTHKLNVDPIVPLFMGSSMNIKEHNIDDIKESIFRCRIYNTNPDANFIFLEDSKMVINRYAKYGLVLKAPECWSVIGE
jgi:hypothetical protein